jgi:hypothetical protein
VLTVGNAYGGLRSAYTTVPTPRSQTLENMRLDNERRRPDYTISSIKNYGAKISMSKNFENKIFCIVVVYDRCIVYRCNSSQ